MFEHFEDDTESGEVQFENPVEDEPLSTETPLEWTQEDVMILRRIRDGFRQRYKTLPRAELPEMCLTVLQFMHGSQKTLDQVREKLTEMDRLDNYFGA